LKKAHSRRMTNLPKKRKEGRRFIPTGIYGLPFLGKEKSLANKSSPEKEKTTKLGNVEVLITVGKTWDRGKKGKKVAHTKS